jgi:hypothetical protein
MKDRMEVENETPGRESLERGDRCWKTEENLLMIRGEAECLEVVKREIFEISPRRGLCTSKCSPPPPPPSNPSLLLMWASSCSASQASWCSSARGQHGSKLVLERLREELGLTLPWYLEKGNIFCRQVLLALVETDNRTRLEVLDKVYET